MRVLVLLAIVLLSAGTAHAACPAGSVEQAGAAVRQARADLMAVPLQEMQEDVPSAVQARIERVKDRLRSFVGSAMACVSGGIDPHGLEAELSAKGDAFIQRTYDRDGHGQGLTYAVAAIPSHPDMIGITATLDIECGADTMLMLYQRQGRDWREIIVRRSPPYKDISGAWLSFQYAVSPDDRDGHWYLATSNIPPWCTSVWRGIRYDLSRQGAGADRPDVFFRKSEGAYIGNDDSGQLNAGASVFELRHDVGSIDFSVFTRKAIRRYSVSGRTVERIPPVATNARDFIDEWIVSPWAEAQAWSAPALKSVHAELAASNTENASADNSFKSLRGCSDGGQQMELDMGHAGHWFINVSGGPDFRLLRAARSPAEGCTGPNRLADIDNR